MGLGWTWFFILYFTRTVAPFLSMSLYFAVLSTSADLSLEHVTWYVVVFFNDSLSSSFVKERGLLAVWESTSGEESFKLFVCPFSCWGAQKTVHLCL